MNNIFNRRNCQIYLLLYSLYMILATFLGGMSYSLYLYPEYKMAYSLSIIVGLIFLLILKDRYGDKSNWDYIIFVFLISILLLRLLFGIQTIPITLVAIFLIISNLKYINLEKFISTDFYTKLFLIISIIILYLLHLTPDTNILYHRNDMLRIGAGFGNYNIFSEFVLCLLFSYILYLGRQAYTDRHIIIIIIIFLITMYFTDTRGFIVSGLALLILLILGKIRILHKLIEYISLFIMIFVSLISILIPIMLPSDSSMFFYVNKIFNNRLLLQHLSVTVYHIRLTGYINILKWLTFYNSNKKVYIDNTYLLLLLSGGMIGFLIFEFVFLKACWIAIKFDNYLLSIIFVSLALSLMVEGIYSNICIYVPIIYAYIMNHNSTHVIKNTNS